MHSTQPRMQTRQKKTRTSRLAVSPHGPGFDLRANIKKGIVKALKKFVGSPARPFFEIDGRWHARSLTRACSRELAAGPYPGVMQAPD